MSDTGQMSYTLYKCKDGRIWKVKDFKEVEVAFREVHNIFKKQYVILLSFVEQWTIDQLHTNKIYSIQTYHPSVSDFDYVIVSCVDVEETIRLFNERGEYDISIIKAEQV